MKALLPIFCRPLGYLVLVLAVFLPFLFVMSGKVTDNNLVFYKECSKLLMMFGSLMVLLALTKKESAETEQIRIISTRAAVFITVIFLFVATLLHITQKHLMDVGTSSFLIFLIINVLCLEFNLKKAAIEKNFKS